VVAVHVPSCGVELIKLRDRHVICGIVGDAGVLDGDSSRPALRREPRIALGVLADGSVVEHERDAGPRVTIGVNLDVGDVDAGKAASGVDLNAEGGQIESISNGSGVVPSEGIESDSVPDTDFLTADAASRHVCRIGDAGRRAQTSVNAPG
jgi:hypothetical protein